MHRKEATAPLSIREWINPALPVPKRSERMKQPACVPIKAKASGNETLLSELASTAIASASRKNFLNLCRGFLGRGPGPRFPWRGRAPH